MSTSNIPQSTPPTSSGQAYSDGTSNILLAPKGVKGIMGFIFDVPGDESAQIDWDVTDHYAESGDFLNDHKVKKPIILTLSGFVGELVFKPPEGIAGILQAASNRLEVVDAYLGDSTPGEVQTAQGIIQGAAAAYSAISQTLDKAQSLVNLFGGGPQLTAQEVAYNSLNELGNEAILAVQTPWRYYRDMTITSLSFTQSGETNQITDITVVLKQVRIGQTKTSDFKNNQSPSREAVQSGPDANQGNVTGTETLSSGIYDITIGQ